MLQPFFSDIDTPSKFLIVFVRVILGKKGVDGVTETKGEIDIVILKGLERK